MPRPPERHHAALRGAGPPREAPGPPGRRGADLGFSMQSAGAGAAVARKSARAGCPVVARRRARAGCPAARPAMCALRSITKARNDRAGEKSAKIMRVDIENAVKTDLVDTFRQSFPRSVLYQCAQISINEPFSGRKVFGSAKRPWLILRLDGKRPIEAEITPFATPSWRKPLL